MPGIRPDAGGYDTLDLRDSEVWVCLVCGYQEVGTGVDGKAQVIALAACWREVSGLLAG